MAQTQREKLDKQRIRQQRIRDRMKAERRPSRDDIARALLHWSITANVRKGRETLLFNLQTRIVEILVAQGFDEVAADASFDDLVDRYCEGWSFRRKQHLGTDDASSGPADLPAALAGLDAPDRD
ncbi:hypothetical protein DFR52_105110 [Hoeflea marina]|uniref:Uncharacterized protein n=1 Tax=Hoeflea marina TaxID=274592 RepID=A0A317PGX3_9HYPH|nr:hypothetical protein [Hoeflea marina]PWV98131.1 hypothetical protein DFR52_105110 [Hoeflea marina]